MSTPIPILNHYVYHYHNFLSQRQYNAKRFLALIELLYNISVKHSCFFLLASLIFRKYSVSRKCIISFYFFQHKSLYINRYVFSHLTFICYILLLNRYVFFTVCNEGTYGSNCNYTCGQCHAKEDCHHVNGTCLLGCEPGYQGDLCKSRKKVTNNMGFFFVMLYFCLIK